MDQPTTVWSISVPIAGLTADLASNTVMTAAAVVLLVIAARVGPTR